MLQVCNFLGHFRFHQRLFSLFFFAKHAETDLFRCLMVGVSVIRYINLQCACCHDVDAISEGLLGGRRVQEQACTLAFRCCVGKLTIF